MKSISKVLSAATMTLAAYPAFANPLDLTKSIKSVVCMGSHASLEYQAATNLVVVDKGQETKTYTLRSLRKAVDGVQLVAQSLVDRQHVAATIRTDGGRSLVQLDGTYFYARCEVK